MTPCTDRLSLFTDNEAQLPSLSLRNKYHLINWKERTEIIIFQFIASSFSRTSGTIQFSFLRTPPPTSSQCLCRDLSRSKQQVNSVIVAGKWFREDIQKGQKEKLIVVLFGRKCWNWHREVLFGACAGRKCHSAAERSWNNVPFFRAASPQLNFQHSVVLTCSLSWSIA